MFYFTYTDQKHLNYADNYEPYPPIHPLEAMQYGSDEWDIPKYIQRVHIRSLDESLGEMEF